MRTRRGFTLIELLVVIVTISILAAIGLQAAGAAIDAARTSATRTTLWRLQRAAQQKAEALDRLQRQSPTRIDDTTEMNLVNRLPAYQGLPLDTKRLLVKKLQLAHYLPQANSEGWDAGLYVPGWTIEDAILRTPLGDWFSADDDLHMVDSWGSPIAFFRWPTDLFAAHPELLPGEYARDPQDPLCQLAGLFTPGQPFDPLMPVVMPTPCKPAVLIFVSPGPDRALGMTGPLGSVTSEQDLSDNLFSVNVR